VKTTQGPGVRDDTGKQVTGRKRHILVETMDLLLALVVTAASVSDPAGAKRLSKRWPGAGRKLRRIWVDGTARGRLREWVILHGRLRLQPVLRCDDQKGFVVLPRRWGVERTFAWITPCRRLGKDDETLPKSSEAMISLAMTRLMIWRLAKA
jgi:putative transposase